MAKHMEEVNQHTHCIVESDCQLVVKAIHSRELIYSPYGRTIDEYKDLLDSMNNVDIVFVKRKNQVTDLLTHYSSSNPGCMVREGCCPS